MSFFVTDEYISSSSSSSEESSESDRWKEELEIHNKVIDDAILMNTKEYRNNAPKRWVQRCVFYEKNKNVIGSSCIDFQDGNVICTRDLKKDTFTIELEQCRNNVDDYVEWGSILPHAIDVYRRLLKTTSIPWTKAEKQQILQTMVLRHGVFCKSVTSKNFDNVLFSNFNSGCLHFMQHSVENANVILETFYIDNKHVAIVIIADDVKKGDILYINRFRPFMSSKMCEEICEKRGYTKHSILSSWTTVRNYCARLSFQIHEEKIVDKVLLQYLSTVPPYLFNIVSSLIFAYLLKKYTVTNTCDEFMKNIKNHPGIMKKFGESLRNMIVRKFYKVWAMERNLLQKKIHLKHADYLSGIG